MIWTCILPLIRFSSGILSLSHNKVFKSLFFIGVIFLITWSWIQSFHSKSENETSIKIACYELEIFAVKPSKIIAWKSYCPTLSNEYRSCLRRDIIRCSSLFPVSFEVHKKTQDFFNLDQHGFSIKCLYTKACKHH